MSYRLGVSCQAETSPPTLKRANAPPLNQSPTLLVVTIKKLCSLTSPQPVPSLRAHLLVDSPLMRARVGRQELGVSIHNCLRAEATVLGQIMS